MTRDTKLKPGRNAARAAAGIIAALAWLAGALAVRAQSEDALKAAFLYNFAKFTEWPASAFSDASARLVIGFIGADALADTFEKNVAGKNANGREFLVKKIADAGAAASCHIVFAGSGGAIVPALKGKPVLTVGENEEFAKSGGGIGFVTEGAKVSFVLNAGSVAVTGLKLDPKLHKVARSVIGG